MRNLFIVGLKLAAVICVFSAALQVSVILVAGQEMRSIYPNLISGALNLTFAYLATVHAAKIADIFGLDGRTSIQGFSARSALRVGFLLIGVNQLIRVLPSFIKLVVLGPDQIVSIPNVGSLLQVALPLALILFADKLTKLIEKDAA